MNFPLVSIIIPVYNGSNYLREAIESAINQVYQNIEIIVINDGSNDNDQTEKIALEFSSDIRYFKKINGGVSSALNLGIKMMKGEYFSWLSHDDLYYPTKISEQINCLIENNYEYDIIISKNRIIDSKGNVIKENVSGKNCEIKWQDFYKKSLKKTVNGCTLLIKRDTLLKTGPFDESYKYSQDSDYWLRTALNQSSYYFLNKVLVSTRWHREQGTKTIHYRFSIELESILEKNFIITKDNSLFSGLANENIKKAIVSGKWKLGKKFIATLNMERKLTIKKRIFFKCYRIYGFFLYILKKTYRGFKNYRFRRDA